MLHKYCPKCASLRLSHINGTLEYKCGSCDFVGEVKEDSIEKINTLRKILQNNNSENNYTEIITNQKIDGNKPDLKEKIKHMSTSSKDWELV
jgi:uncharacterized Zn finger protein (UPF0148 family)